MNVHICALDKDTARCYNKYIIARAPRARCKIGTEWAAILAVRLYPVWVVVQAKREEVRPRRAPRRDFSPKGQAMNKRTLLFGLLRILAMLAVTFVLLFFYLFANRQAWTAVFWIYAAALTALGIAYISWNRGFTRMGVSRDMLPAAWDDAQKDRFLAEAATWRRQSRCLLYLIIPLCLTFLYDIVDLFLGDALRNAFPFLGGIGW